MTPAVPATISFLSDYGLADEFVGVVKAVIRQIAPASEVLDITHEVPPHDVRAASLTLVRSVQYLPAGIVLAVVDPEVGTQRRAIAVEVDDDERPLVLIGPDNGLLAPAVALSGGARRAVSLTNVEYHLPAPGPTFAGRDVFGPAAAHLALGVPFDDLGEPVDPHTLRPGVLPLSRPGDEQVDGEVLWVDRFGNAQLNIDPSEVEALGTPLTVRLATQTRTAVRAATYAELGTDLGLVVDSYGLLSLAFDRRSAADELRITAGAAVTLAKAE